MEFQYAESLFGNVQCRVADPGRNHTDPPDLEKKGSDHKEKPDPFQIRIQNPAPFFLRIRNLNLLKSGS